MKISHLIVAAVLGTTLLATAKPAAADRWYRGGYVRAGWVAPRVYARPYIAPRVVVGPGYYNPYYAPAPVVVAPRPYYVAPRPVIVRRGWYRRW